MLPDNTRLLAQVGGYNPSLKKIYKSYAQQGIKKKHTAANVSALTALYFIFLNNTATDQGARAYVNKDIIMESVKSQVWSPE